MERALATDEAVSTTMDRMQAAGEMKEINRAFKAARLDNPSLRYGDYLRTRKAIMKTLQRIGFHP